MLKHFPLFRTLMETKIYENFSVNLLHLSRPQDEDELVALKK